MQKECIHLLLHSIAIVFLTTWVTGCNKSSDTLSDFKSDGCTLFPDQSLIENIDWCECCLEHDIAYWQGGSKAQRLEADKNLRDCVLEKTGNQTLAETMYQGVRFGGSPYFYNWYRWGYGWNYSRKYQKLTSAEQRMVGDKLFKYFKQVESAGSPCD